MMDITMPMAAPLLESTAVAAESSIHKSQWHSHITAKKLEANPNIQSEISSSCKSIDLTPVQPDKYAGNNSLLKKSCRNGDDDKVDYSDDFDSFFQDDAHNRLGLIPAPITTEKLGGISQAELHGSVGFDVCGNVDSDLARDSTSAGENSRNSIEKDSLDQSTTSDFSCTTSDFSITPKISHSSITSTRTLTPNTQTPARYESTQMSGSEATSNTPVRCELSDSEESCSTSCSIRKVCNSARVCLEGTFSVSPSEMCHKLSTSARGSDVLEQLLRRADNPPVRSAISRFRLDPATNKFEEVPPMVANIRVYECSSRLPEHTPVPASRGPTSESRNNSNIILSGWVKTTT